MDPKQLFIDDRLKGICAYCGDFANSRDHVPSRILLDEPYPDNLPIAESCAKCNGGFSSDEEYVACLIECVIHGTTQPNPNFRKKILRTLESRPSIAAKIESGKKFDQNNNPVWSVEYDRVKRVVLKLARGHISYELGIQHIEEPAIINILAVPYMTDDELESFNSFEEDSSNIMLPEIGSRAFINLFSGKTTAYFGWQVVQDERYRYAIGTSSGNWVKFILSEYLACQVVW